MSQTPPESEIPHDAGDETRTEVTIRRAPKFSAFLVVGALVGAIATLILVSLFPVDPAVGVGATYGFFLLFGVPLGALLGAVAAIVLDRRASRRAAPAVAGKLSVRAEDSGQSADDSTRGDKTQG